jgi:hypothetical protein
VVAPRMGSTFMSTRRKFNLRDPSQMWIERNSCGCYRLWAISTVDKSSRRLSHQMQKYSLESICSGSPRQTSTYYISNHERTSRVNFTCPGINTLQIPVSPHTRCLAKKVLRILYPRKYSSNACWLLKSALSCVSTAHLFHLWQHTENSSIRGPCRRMFLYNSSATLSSEPRSIHP